MNNRRWLAFSFTEVMIVVAILGIVAAISIPRFAKAENAKLQNAASIFVADIDFARIDSMTHVDDPCVVVFDMNAGTYHLARQSDPGTPIQNAMTDSPYVRAFGKSTLNDLSGVIISSVSVGPDNQLSFGPLGELDQADEATIKMSCKGRTLTITLDPVIADSVIGEIQ